MKKYLLTSILAIGLLLGNIAANAADKIVPQKLTQKNTGNYTIINSAVEKVFSNMIPRLTIDQADIYSTFEDEYNLVKLPENKYRNSNYIYVKHKFAELVYAKNGKDLVAIRVEKIGNPKSYAVYDYPTGRLKYFEFYDDATKDFFRFTPYGGFYNPRSYLTNMSLRITRKLNEKHGTTALPAPVRFYVKVDKLGNIMDLRIQQSCGDSLLEESMLDEIRSLAPFDKFSKTFPDDLEMIMEYGPRRR